MAALDRPTDRDFADWLILLAGIREEAAQTRGDLQVLQQVAAERIAKTEERAAALVERLNETIEVLGIASKRPASTLPKGAEERLRALRYDLLNDPDTTTLTATDTLSSVLEEFAPEVPRSPRDRFVESLLVAVRALRAEAVAFGDAEKFALCDRALSGDVAALHECAAVIAEVAGTYREYREGGGS